MTVCDDIQAVWPSLFHRLYDLTSIGRPVLAICNDSRAPTLHVCKSALSHYTNKETHDRHNRDDENEFS